MFGPFRDADNAMLVAVEVTLNIGKNAQAL